VVIEVFPKRIVAMDKLHFPRSAPVFDVHFALFGRENIIVPFGIDEGSQAVLLGETVGVPFGPLVTM
jgi:hypothetical protein